MLGYVRTGLQIARLLLSVVEVRILGFISVEL